MDNFFPTADYKVPSTSKYLKFQDGENTFRVLSSAIVGYEYFNTDNKPVRSRELFEETPDIKENSAVKHFWAFVVWNYDAKQVQILELTQASIMRPMEALIKNPKWGNPKNYDITVNKSGSMLTTEYSVVPNPHSKLEQEIADKYAKTKINLEALYTGADPFQSDSKSAF